MFSIIKNLFSRKNNFPREPSPGSPSITVDIRVSDYPAALKLSKTQYAHNSNLLLSTAIASIEALEGKSLTTTEADYQLHETARLCDLALFDIMTRHQHYTIIKSESQKIRNDFINHFKELYAVTFLNKIDARIDTLIKFIENRKLTKDAGTTMWEKLKAWGNKVKDEFVDSFKNLLSLIPIMKVKSDYSKLLEEYLGEEALKCLHNETLEAIRPEIENRIRERINLLSDEITSIAADFPIRGLSPGEAISSSFKVTGFTMLMSGAGTMVLTAGWHTIAWSTLNLLLPMIIYLVIPGTILAAVGLQNRDLNKRKDSLKEAKDSIHSSILEHTVLELAERIRTHYQEGESARENELVKKLFPGLDNISISLVRSAIKDLNSAIGKLDSYLTGPTQDDYTGELLKRCLDNSMSSPLEDSLLLASCFDSLISFCNRKFHLGGNTIRDGGSAFIIAELKERGFIDDNQFNILTSARRIRNRLAHHVHDFIRLPESQQASQGKVLMEGIREIKKLVKD